MQLSKFSNFPSRKILVVEDEGLIAHDIASRLRALNHEVIAIAGTAEEAIEKAREAELVLMDIGIDGPADGIHAATAIRQRYRVPVVFLTARVDRATIERAKSAAPFGYIVKPVAPASLNSSIEIAIYKHGVERRLEEREAWLSTILGSIGEALVVTDPEGEVLMLNHAAEALTGCTDEKAHGQPMDKIARMMEGDLDGESAEPVALAILSDAPVSLDRGWKLLVGDGREIPIEGSVAPVKVSGAATGVVLSFRDVSARQWKERHVHQSLTVEAAGRLAAGVSSEYSNLMDIIRTQAEHLLRQFGEYSPARKAAEEIQHAAAAAEQINRRLTVSGTRQVAQQEVLSLNSMVRKTVKLIEMVTGDTIRLAIRTAPSKGRIKVDVEQIQQAIMTLVLHAGATLPVGEPLQIETGTVELPWQRPAGGYAQLAVTYSGEESDPEKLFEPSAAGDQELSLSTVHSIVTGHNGFIYAKRVASGKCRVEMLLPQQTDQAQLARLDRVTAPSILLVEDRDRIRLHLHNLFEANGYNLLEAVDETEAVAIGQMHEGGLDLLIAESSQANTIAQDIGDGRLRLLRIVDGPESGPEEIHRPFSQKALLRKVEALLRPRQTLCSAAAS